MRRNTGFTLMELMIVIAVIGILVGIAVPGIIGWLPNYRLRAATRDLQSVMQRSRLRAIKENTRVVMLFDTGNDEYVAFVDDGEGGGIANDNIQNGSERTVINAKMPRDVDLYNAAFAGGVPRTRFNSRGLPNGTGGHAYMKNSKNRYMGVVLRITGNSRIVKSTDGGGTWN